MPRPSIEFLNARRAFVQTVYRRKHHVGYSVFVEWFDNGVKHGHLVKTFWLKDQAADIALYLANTLRNDINGGDNA